RIRDDDRNRVTLNSGLLKRFDRATDNFADARYRSIHRNRHTIAGHDARRQWWKFDRIVQGRSRGLSRIDNELRLAIGHAARQTNAILIVLRHAARNFMDRMKRLDQGTLNVGCCGAGVCRLLRLWHAKCRTNKYPGAASGGQQMAVTEQQMQTWCETILAGK